ncbi:hypothetical protein GW17_00007059 [Ensete ventricosum]|nr:hypothetical protein GW17_00007059 [Ensete ventricosum]
MEDSQHAQPFGGKLTLRCRERSRSEERASRFGIQRNGQPFAQEAPRGQASEEECWCIAEIVLVGDRGPGSRQWCINSSEMKTLVVSIRGLCIIGAAREVDCFSAHIRLREPGKSEDKADPVRLSYPKVKQRLERRWTRRSTSVAEADLPIAKEGMQMQVNG